MAAAGVVVAMMDESNRLEASSRRRERFLVDSFVDKQTMTSLGIPWDG